MKKRALLLILRVAKSFGFFWIARRLTARDLRILCYHGAALADEEKFRPRLFIRRDTFAKRMDFLTRKGFPVLGLGEALECLDRGTLPDGATVITIDDGWYGTFKEMVPVLKSHRFPATLYVATYHMQKQTQVLEVALSYVLWCAGEGPLDLARVSTELSGQFDLSDKQQRESAAAALADYGNGLESAASRQEVLRRVCDVVGVDWRRIEAERLCGFMNESEARAALLDGIDLQLHTHRHRLPDDSFDTARVEIDDNRAALASITRRSLEHFCYPSGKYSPRQLSWLRQLAISTATTTMHGFNGPTTPKLELRRFLDSEAISSLEFEAEMCGFFELIRKTGRTI